MTEVKLRRLAARQLVQAMMVARGCDIPPRFTNFRYAIKRNLDSLLSDFNATNEAYVPPKEDATEEAKKDFDARWRVHVDEEITVRLHLSEVPELNDLSVPEEKRGLQNQALIDWLSPMFRDREEEPSKIIRL